MKYKILSSISTIGLAGVLMLGVASPSLAQEKSVPPANSKLADSESASLLLHGASDRSVEAEEMDQLEREKLEELRGTQTPEEISAIANSPEPAVLLFDPVIGKYVAAYEEKASLGARAIFMRGPGCATTDACMLSGTTHLGYYGTGSLAGDWRSVTRLSAGNYTTTFWYGGSGTFVAANKSVQLTVATNFNKITRS